MVGEPVRMSLNEALSQREEYLRQWLTQFSRTLEQSTEYDSPPRVEVHKPARTRLLRR